ELVDLSWLLPENDPKPSKPYPLSDHQVDVVIQVYQKEKNCPEYPYIESLGAAENRFMERLENRGLIHCGEEYVEHRRHGKRWFMTEKGRSIASGLSDLPF
ncbi:MAG TPA: hypothetical protein VFK47_03325, partial [Ktedonobacteraceae bacterium]|nr:hypothetical protein [Ktedonobacteraceae bacterium]